MEPLFSSNDHKPFKWNDIETFFVRSQYNELLKLVVEQYFSLQYNKVQNPPNTEGDYNYIPAKNPNNYPSFLNINRALTLTEWDERCQCSSSSRREYPPLTVHKISASVYTVALNKLIGDFELALLESGVSLTNNAVVFMIDLMKKKHEKKEQIEEIQHIYSGSKKLEPGGFAVVKEQKNGREFKELIGNAAHDAIKATFGSIIGHLNNVIDWTANNAADIDQVQREYQLAIRKFEKARHIFDSAPTEKNQKSMEKEMEVVKEKEVALRERQGTARTADYQNCHDEMPNYLCMPKFLYQRKIQNRYGSNDEDNMSGSDKIEFLKFDTNGLTVGAVIWLYYYERMGIFKILGALMDDYNYKGKYTISGSRDTGIAYSKLMDMICTLYRTGISSNLRDRICTYQRVLGVDVENNLGIESERNEGFMENFKKVIDHALEYYDAKRLAKAIQNTGEPKSSVATQTSILDAIRLLKEQFEPFQYGRNQINTYLGIATVHATLCLLHMLRKEIGIPDQYDKPEEFVPAAYDLLVEKRRMTRNTTNRFIVYDNCASYGYRLLTDLELANIEAFNISDTNSNLTVWLDDVEGVIEGYRSAYASVPEKAAEMV